MGVMAKWNGKVFSVSSKAVKPISDFTTTYAMKDDTNDDTSGTKKTNTRGRAPEEPSFSVKYLATAGAKPRTEFTSWRSMVGKSAYLYIGNTKYGNNKFELRSAAVSDVVLDNKGRTIQAVVTLKFLEKMPTKKKSPTVASDKKLKNSSKKKTGTSAKSKKAAKNAKASKADKKSKSPYGTVKGAMIN